MSEKEKTGKVHVEPLELNEESIKELTDTESDAVRGGLIIKGGGSSGWTCAELNTLLSTCTKVDSNTDAKTVTSCFRIG